MSRKESINALIQKAEKQFEAIEKEYNASLHDKKIKPELKVDIKNFFENLRSVLDYLAHDMRESAHVDTGGGKNFYFPILPTTNDFNARMTQWFPGLEQKNPDLYAYLLSIQPFQGNTAWLGHFNKVNNENKHGNLVEQTREEHERVHVTNPNGGEVSWNPSAVKFGPGVSTFGVGINPATQMPNPSPSIQVKRVLWVDFQFDGVGVSALSLMKLALKGIKDIAKEIESKI